jgi:GWxTD domain-containing protein
MRLPAVTAALVVLALAAGCSPVGGPPIDAGTPASLGGLRFAADVTVAPSDDGRGVIRISYVLTYDSLPFLRVDGGYRARYEMTAIVYDMDGRQVTGDSWRRTVEVATYGETNSRRTADADVVEFTVDPGRYALKLELTSIDTRASGRIDRLATVPEMEPGTLTMGTIVFETEATSPDGAGGAALNPARIYGEDNPTVIARIPVYGAPGPAYVLEQSVHNERGILQKAWSDTLEQTAFLTEHVEEFTVLDLEVGAHLLRVDLVPLDEGEASRQRARFRVVTSPLSWGEDPEKMIDQISYVATREEMDFLTSVPAEERDPLWEEFWASRDPEPSTVVNEFKTEFLRRLGYANAQFTSIVEGWQTDMGRVYIQLGEPDDIDSQPIGQMLNAWEIWYYYSEHTKYVFVDREGFGEFVLHEVSRI